MNFFFKNRDRLDQIVLYGICVAVLLALLVQLQGAFFNAGNLRSILEQIPEFTLFALAMGLVMISGGIDLSVIAVANLSGIFAAMVMANTGLQHSFGIGGVIALGCATAVAASALMGLLNGVITVGCGIPPLLTTLGTMMLFSGLGIGLTGGAGMTGMPASFVGALSARIGGVVPLPFTLILVVFVFAGFYMRRSLFGATLFLYGENKVAALFTGLRIDRALVTSYVVSGILAGLAGLIMLARFNSVKVGYGDTFLLQAILVAVLSGIDPDGGKGRLFNILVTVLLLQCLQNAFTIMNFSPYAKKMIWAAMLLLFMVINYFLALMADRSLAAATKRAK